MIAWPDLSLAHYAPPVLQTRAGSSTHGKSYIKQAERLLEGVEPSAEIERRRQELAWAMRYVDAIDPLRNSL